MALAGWGKTRQRLLVAALLDAAGLTGLFVGLAAERNVLGPLPEQLPLLAMLLVSYCTLGWLFGSYTLLKVRRLRWSQLVLRLGATSTASLLIAALLEWGLGTSPELTLLHRGSIVPAFGLAAVWSGGNRLLLRRLWATSLGAEWLVLKQPEETLRIAPEWRRGGQSGTAPVVTTLKQDANAAEQLLNQLEPGEGLALSAGMAEDLRLQEVCEQVVRQGLPVTTLVELAEQELQRIPPSWVGRQWLLFSQRIDGVRSTPNQQLKRYADVLVSVVLLVLSSPLWLLSALVIHLQDGGPVFYRQVRSGLLGQPFEVLKFRTMVPNAEDGQAQWAQNNDKRVTPFGSWLRSTRIDELPQLLNVLRGEMSLIGPRPERPELEATLEQQIPNYRVRHWIRPGLSGWAQVNMPYGASVEDSELKLSYDLFYLRNASPWLDLLILLKTIKTVLKAAGR